MNTPRPNILLIQADQLAPQTLPAYGRPLTKAPHLQSLADRGIVFDNAYCNSPLCAPSRYSMLTGRYASRIGAYDNAAEFRADLPTLAHYLRASGYRTCLSGKMHFVGADQLHGYEDRLTTDVYPADYGWTPDWRDPGKRFDWWYHNMDSVTQAGPCERTNQIDFDDETGFRAVRRIYDLARDNDPRPFFLTVSFTNPHDPYACPREHWDRYDPRDIDPPRVGHIPYDECDPHSRRLRRSYRMDRGEMRIEDVLNARRAYYGQISYVDDKIGDLLKALGHCGLADDTIIVFTADHGDMLGERGLWYKMSFFEWSCRVPLIVTCPERFGPGRRSEPVSLVDLVPTLLDLVGAWPEEEQVLDGQSLTPWLNGSGETHQPVIAEYMAEGAAAPCFLIREHGLKYIHSPADPPQLYDLRTDPDELVNLSGRPEYAADERSLAERLANHQDAEKLHREILESQKQRRVVFKAHMSGRRTPWDFSPREDCSARYMRNHLDLNDVECRARIPSQPARAIKNA